MRTDPVVLARKRKSVSLGGSTKSPKVRGVVQRGIVNWAPPAIDGEDETSCKAHMRWMQKEKKKRQYNHTLVGKKMDLTYSFRRQMINGKKHMLKDIEGKYPFLFEQKQVCI